MNQTGQKTTHFGYREVPLQDKTALVHGVFESVAGNYDLMNDLMSMGVHRLWKRYFVSNCGIEMGQQVLDLAGGTGDIAALISPLVGGRGSVVLSDINQAMLNVGRERLEDKGIVGNVSYALANAESLPFPDRSFHAVTIAFGLRNVTNKDKALRQALRVLKPGGKMHILEFSKVRPEPLKKIYDGYSFGILPLLGKLIAKDADSYQYLAESIRKHPGQSELAELMREAGFADVTYENLSGGIVAIHRGQRA
jgi:demethylmenaquinone methyltransferase/2-methoxy-6-polyprenyl-1,4-benzoquinol methylase